MSKADTVSLATAKKTDRAPVDKADAKEERKLEKMSAEAQAFLLSNQKKVISETASVASLGKLTSTGGKALQVKAAAAKAPAAKATNLGAATNKTSFSKAGKAICHKML